METAKVSSTFLSNIVEKLNISRFSDTDLALKAILKNKNHPSIITIESKYKHVSNFSFVVVNEANIEKGNKFKWKKGFSKLGYAK